MLRYTTQLVQLLPPCTCRRFASTSTSSPSPVDTLLAAAQRVIRQVQEAQEHGGIEAAKRKRETEGLARALEDVEQGQEVHIYFPLLSVAVSLLAGD